MENKKTALATTAASNPIKTEPVFDIAITKFGRGKNWLNKKYTWTNIVKAFEKENRTSETVEEYHALRKIAKEEKDKELKKKVKEELENIKDVGGFVGGFLLDGKREKTSVITRSLLTLDLDECKDTKIYEKLKKLADTGIKYIVHSSHSHLHNKPRLRLIIPLLKNLSSTGGEYEFVLKQFVKKHNLEDESCESSFRRNQFMYFPSTPKDGEYYFDARIDGDYLDISDFMVDFKKANIEKETEKKVRWKKDDGQDKPGIIGAYCRTYDVRETLNNFLTDVYSGPDERGRYTYLAGEGVAGLVIKDDGRLCQSFHGTDPAAKKNDRARQCNGFDLILIHKFNDDMGKINEVIKWCAAQKGVQDDPQYAEESSGPSWDPRHISYKNGISFPRLSLSNLRILLNYVNVKIRYNEFTHQLEWADGRKWADEDIGVIKDYCQEFHFVGVAKVYLEVHMVQLAKENGYHPVKDYLEGLPAWDGIPRVETLLSKYFDAKDTPYTRTVMRKTLAAAIRRIYHPGSESKYMLVLSGPQDIGKSSFWYNLCGSEWFSDSLKMSDMADKRGVEALMGKWIVEISELAGMRKMQIEDIKGFLARKTDSQRLAYAKNPADLPRQSIIVGTTNSPGFLKDPTGNCRWWVIRVTKRLLDVLDRDQIWAEAMTYWKDEPHQLPPELMDEARRVERQNIETDDRMGIVFEYLEKPIPEESIWNSMDIQDRIRFLGDDGNDKDNPFLSANVKIDKTKLRKRNHVCAYEIFVECFGENKAKFEMKHSTHINLILTALGWTDVPAKRYKYYGKQRTKVRPLESEKTDENPENVV